MPLNFIGGNTDRHVDLGTLDVPASTGELTICGWVNPITVDSGSFVALFYKADSGSASGQNWGVRIRRDVNNNTLRCVLATTSTGNLLSGVTPVPVDVWTFWAMTYDGVTKKLFFNDIEDASESQSGDVANSTRPTLMAAIDSGVIQNELDGALDDVRLYTRALTQAEITTIFNARGEDGIVADLLHRWTLDEKPSGETATVAGSIKDSGPGQFDGTPVNSPTYRDGILNYRRRV